MDEEEGGGQSSLPDLNLRQQEVFDLMRRAPEESLTVIGFGGSIGGGKTHLLARAGISLSLSYPGNRILVGRNTFNRLETTTLEEFDDICPPQILAKRYDSPPVYRDLRLPSWPKGLASRVYFRGLEDWQGLGSEKYGAVLLDEASETATDVPLMLFTRLRHRLPREVRVAMRRRCRVCNGYSRTDECAQHGATIGQGMKYYLIAASNPWPGWFEDWFLRGDLDAILMDVPDVNIHFVPSRIRDNVANLPPGYEAKQRALLPAHLQRRLIDGEFGVFEGTIYPHFNSEIHRWIGPHPEETKEYVRVIGGLDFGNENETTGHYSAGLVAVLTKSGRLIRVAEFKERGPDIAERQVNWMMAMEQRWATPIHRRVEWRADRSQGFGIQLVRKAFHITPSRGGNDSVNEGIKAVARRLLPDGAGIPGSFYLPELKKWEAEMKKYRRDPKTLDVIKLDDDLVACDRYMEELVTAPVGNPQKMYANALAVVR